jgi:acetyltransferase-like isoleucine patch superfamily enzyme
MLIVSPTARLSALADIEPSVRGSRLVVGDETVIDSFVRIKFAGGTGDVIIGRGCVLNSGTVIYSGHGVSLGDNVLIAANCTLAPTNHQFADRTRPIRSQGFRPGRGGIVIEDDVWIGCNSVLLDGAVLRQGCVIGAASLVRGEVPAWAVAAGNPLKIIGARGGGDGSDRR